MEYLEAILLIVGVLTIVVTLLPFLPGDVWWIRGWEFTRIQIGTIALIVLILYPLVQQQFGTFDLLFIVALFLCLLYHGIRIFPYTPLARKRVQTSQHPQAETTIRLLFVNVEMPNRQMQRLKEIIHAADPDIILAVETDAWWQAQLQELAETHPHTLWHVKDNYFGMMLFSRLELLQPQVKFLVQDDVPSIHTQVRLRAGQTINLHCLHPRPPAPDAGNEQATERDAELLLLGRQLEHVDVPTVVLGDLNDVAWSPTIRRFRRMSGLLDPRMGRGFYNSFHTRYFVLRFPLDHLFHSEHFHLVDFVRLPAFGSDHFPMLVTLHLEPKAEQKAPSPTPADEEQASQKIDEAN